MAFGRLSIVLSTHAAQFDAVAFKGDLEANLARIAAMGYAGVELAVRDPRLIDSEKLETALHDQDLSLVAIGTGQAWGEEHLSFTSQDAAVRRAAITRIKSQIELAQRFSALLIIGLIRGVTPAGQSKIQSMEYFVGCMQECSDLAKENNVKLAVEPLNRYETDLVHNVEECLELIQRVGSTNVGILLDTFHMNIEERDIVESILKAGEQIYHFHVADSNRWYPGGGHLDFETILKTLRSVRYSGWISGEFLPVPDSDNAAKNSYEHLVSILERI